MMKKIIAITVLLLILIGGVSGCTQSSKIKNQEQASQAVVEVSKTIDDISSSLDSIDKTLK